MTDKINIVSLRRGYLLDTDGYAGGSSSPSPETICRGTADSNKRKRNKSSRKRGQKPPPVTESSSDPQEQPPSCDGQHDINYSSEEGINYIKPMPASTTPDSGPRVVISNTDESNCPRLPHSPPVMESVNPALLQKELAESRVERDQLATKNNQLAAENDQLATRYDELAAEKQQIANKNKKLVTEKHQLSTQIDQLTLNNEKLAVEKHELAAQNEQLSINNEKLAAEKRDLAAQNDQLATKCDRLVEEKQKVTTMNEKLITENCQLFAEKSQLVADLEWLRTENSKLSQQAAEYRDTVVKHEQLKPRRMIRRHQSLHAPTGTTLRRPPSASRPARRIQSTVYPVIPPENPLKKRTTTGELPHISSK